MLYYICFLEAATSNSENSKVEPKIRLSDPKLKAFGIEIESENLPTLESISQNSADHPVYQPSQQIILPCK